jgi:phenylalanyl-tRNA synthetase beta chain
MKFSYTLLRRLLPGVPPAKKLALKLNLYSFEVEEAKGDMLDIKIPANQYSAMASHIGIAREASAIFGLSFRNPVRTIVNIPMGRGLVRVKIDEPALCSRYAVRVFDLKRVADSPAEIKKILHACGINSVNFVVDIMNLVMLETGQPLHAFDAEKIKGSIHIRRARKGEEIETLDKKTQELDPSVLVIADDASVLAIAGIKGGFSSGVTKATRRIILEAASFDQGSIYKTSQALKLMTDASVRFSHGISPALVDIGLDRATELLTKIGVSSRILSDKTCKGARLVDSADAGRAKIGDEIIDFDPAGFERLIGIPAPIADVKRYFTALGFTLQAFANRKSGGRGFPPSQKRSNVFRVRVPAWRNDIENPEDLYEEAARLMGYNELPKCVPLFTIQPAREDDSFLLKDKIRNILSGLAMNEVYNNSFYGAAESKNEKFSLMFGNGVAHAEVLNPVSEDMKFLRRSLVPLLFENYESNARYFEEVRIFEIGKVFGTAVRGTEEKLALGIFIAAKKDHKLILELKGVADELFGGLGVGDFSFVPEENGMRVEADHNVLGIIGTETLKHGWVCAYAEFDLEKTLALTEEGREFVPLKKFPSVTRDISVLVGRDARIGDVIHEIESANFKLIENVDLIDEYKDETLGGKQSITFRIIFQADDRTLTDAEVNREMEKIYQALRIKFRAEIR